MPEDLTGVDEEGKGEIIAPPADSSQESAADLSEEKEGKPEKPKLSETEKALIQSREDEKKKARLLEEQNLYLQQQLAALQQQQQPKVEEEEFDPDTVITGADLIRWEQKRIEKEQKRQQKEQYETTQNRILSNVNQTKDKYKDSEWSYDWAYDYAKKHFSPDDLNAISLMSEPAQKLYDLVMLQPENRDKISSKERQETIKTTLDTIQKNLNAPGTLSNVMGSDRIMDSIKRLDKMSNKEFLEFADSIARQKTG